MSWHVTLNDPTTKEVIEFNMPHFLYGCNYAITPTGELAPNYLAELNVTYNYSSVFAEYLDKTSLNYLNNQQANNMIPKLADAICALHPHEPVNNYWENTPGNAREALRSLLFFAVTRPDGVFSVE